MMHIETVGPLHVLALLTVLEQKLVGQVPVNAGDQETHAYAVDEHDPKDEFDYVEKAQLHDQTEKDWTNDKYETEKHEKGWIVSGKLVFCFYSLDK